jgi:hypothetical protein
MFAVTYLGGELKSLLGLEEGLAALVQGEEQVRPVLRIRIFFIGSKRTESDRSWICKTGCDIFLTYIFCYFGANVARLALSRVFLSTEAVRAHTGTTGIDNPAVLWIRDDFIPDPQSG